LQIIPALDAGGAERTTIEITSALTAEGFTALVASEGGRMEPDLAQAGGELIRMRAASKSPGTVISNARRLRDIIRARDVKIIHARSRAPAWSALLAARWTRIPLIATYHGFYNASNPVKRFYNSVMLRGDAVIANSQWTADHIASEYRFKPRQLAVVPRGVDLSLFDPAGISPERITELRGIWGAGENDFVVLLPGRLTRWKGQSVLIDALARLKQQNRLGEIRAILAGDAQGRDAYETELHRAIESAGLKDRIFIAGHINDMATAYAAADVTVSASTDPEAFGRVTAEASAMGKPVIASDHGGARETVLANVSGLLVKPGDPAALADAIANIAAMSPDARAEMGSAGRAHIARNYSKERMCADTIALYRTLLSREG
jgi:glycosyltransferase involved in cell wall biosynthesis